ncbi:MAG: hypothetical protein CMH61_02220 [Nanoarchaeota archaeon]|nr:hypothetical protein [Nanoarchaeota archaeon]|tara:strand:+ start:1767 stop:2420 length:654 start_codon:yes stop_codon:yes gene_type:complete
MIMKKRETVIIFSAHSDDFVIGAGGTIAKYSEEGKKVLVFVMSYGEKSHPWMKDNVTKKFRSEEAFKASEVLGCTTTFFNLKEFDFKEEAKRKRLIKKIKEIVITEKPSKIFTHSDEDPHPDHRATHLLTLDVFDLLKKKPDVYIYSIWNPVSMKTLDVPKMYVDISSTFKKKLQALKLFRSQYQAILPLSLQTLFRNLKAGLKIKKKMGEEFYKIK